MKSFNLEKGKLIDDFFMLALAVEGAQGSPKQSSPSIATTLESLAKKYECAIAPNASITIPELKGGLEQPTWALKAIADQLTYCITTKLENILKELK